MTIIAEGNSLKDGSNVLAKIAPAQSNGSLYLEREAHMYVETIVKCRNYSSLVLAAWDTSQAHRRDTVPVFA
jgi:hypothetical protein